MFRDPFLPGAPSGPQVLSKAGLLSVRHWPFSPLQVSFKGSGCISLLTQQPPGTYKMLSKYHQMEMNAFTRPRWLGCEGECVGPISQAKKLRFREWFNDWPKASQHHGTDSTSELPTSCPGLFPLPCSHRIEIINKKSPVWFLQFWLVTQGSIQWNQCGMKETLEKEVLLH